MLHSSCLRGTLLLESDEGNKRDKLRTWQRDWNSIQKFGELHDRTDREFQLSHTLTTLSPPPHLLTFVMAANQRIPAIFSRITSKPPSSPYICRQLSLTSPTTDLQTQRATNPSRYDSLPR